jgi:hypothetical protein
MRNPIPQPLSTSDRDSWLEAASHRNPPAMPDIRKLRAWLFGRNPWKYRQLRKLIRWAEREYSREFGIYPEDARWLLP